MYIYTYTYYIYIYICIIYLYIYIKHYIIIIIIIVIYIYTYYTLYYYYYYIYIYSICIYDDQNMQQATHSAIKTIQNNINPNQNTFKIIQDSKPFKTIQKHPKPSNPRYLQRVPNPPKSSKKVPVLYFGGVASLLFLCAMAWAALVRPHGGPLPEYFRGVSC